MAFDDAVYGPNDEHHRRLIEGVINLHGVMVVLAHQVFIVQACARADKDSESEAEIVDSAAFSLCRRGVFLSEGENKNTSECQHDAHPLPGVKTFTEDQ